MASNLTEAISYYSGGLYRIDLSDSVWHKLQKRIDAAGYTAYEFCHFIVYEGAEAAQLGWKNTMASKKYWGAFLEYKKNRLSEVGLIVRLQRHHAEAWRKYGWNLERILLDEQLEINAVVRLELALYEEEKTGFDPQPVIDKCRDAAEELLLGCPEYLEYSPQVREKHERLDFSKCRFGI